MDELPGAFPFTRGIQPTMYRGRLWTMRQYAGFGTAAESNRRYHYLLGQGVSGLSVAFDLPTQMGYDSDHALARGEVGRVGVAIDSLADMDELFAGIPLDRVSTSMTINATAIILLALYVAVARRQGLSGDTLRAVSGTISGYHIREAGSTAVQEVAFTFANAIAYVQAAVDAGLDVNRLGQRLSFFFNAHNDFLEEIGKFRAARRLWATIMRDRFHATNPRAQQLRFHTQTAGSTLTAQQPDNNIVRVALQALAAVLGGTQSLHCNGRDEALALPTEESAGIALRTQQIIAFESGVPNTVDPVGGSQAIEDLTDTIEREARAILERIDNLGGTLAAIESAVIQREIQDAAYVAQQKIDGGDTVVVGVNRYADPPPNDDLSLGGGSYTIETLTLDPSIEARQVERVKAVRAARDERAWRAAIDAVTAAARGTDNLVPPIITAVEAHATVGEISDAMRAVFGEHRDADVG
jgi:methylmalonyl-CoA mutase N-terminal domain/subunit